MLQDFTFALQTRFVFGKTSIEKLGEELQQLGICKILLHHDSGEYLVKTGLLQQVKDILEQAGIAWVELGGVEPNPRVSLVREGVKLAKEEKVNGVLAIGGGSVIDSAKAIAAGACIQQDVWDCFTGKHLVEKALAVAVILTNPASGSESSPVAMLNNQQTHEKNMLSSCYIQPKLAILNPELTLALPAHITANGIVDMFSHVFERYFTSDTEYGIIDGMAEGAMASIVDWGIYAIEHLDDYSARANLMWAATVAHNDTLGVGRRQDWASHLIANELSALYDTPHGVSLSIIIPAWMKQVYHHDIPRFARFAQRVFGLQAEGENAAKMGIEATIQFFEKLGMPVSFAQGDIPTNEVDTLTQMVQMPPKGTIGASMPLSRQDVKEIFTKALV